MGSFANMLTPGNSISAFDELKRRVCIMAVQSSAVQGLIDILEAESPVDREKFMSKTRPKRRGATKYLNSWKRK